MRKIEIRANRLLYKDASFAPPFACISLAYQQFTPTPVFKKIMPKNKTLSKTLHVHLVSDSTGDTVHRVAQACLSQFDMIETEEHVWSLVRGSVQIENLMRGVENYPGIIIATFADRKIAEQLDAECKQRKITYISVLDPIFQALRRHLGEQGGEAPGKQHELTEEYFDKIEAMDFAMHHDDGQLTNELDRAEVILVGVSRTSKTPTCIYLSHRGVKAANVPIVPGVELPKILFESKHPLIIGLTNDPARLIQIRETRLQMISSDGKYDEANSYIDPERVREEIRAAQRLFAQQGWPVIDVTRKSVEETAAIILQMYQDRKQKAAGEPAKKSKAK